MTANETTLSRILNTAAALLRAALPATSPALAGGATLDHAAESRATFGGNKSDREEVEPAVAAFPRGL